jgi:hypothetical protein
MNTITVEAQKLIDRLSGWVKERTLYLPFEGIEFRPEKMELCQCTLYRNDQGILPEFIQEHHRVTNALEWSECYLEVTSLSDHKKTVKDALYKASPLKVLQCAT